MEKHLEAKFRKAVIAKGGLALKWVSPGYSGVPDRIVLMPGGKVYFVELKNGAKEPDPLQKIVHRELIKLGFDVRTIGFNHEISDFIDEL